MVRAGRAEDACNHHFSLRDKGQEEAPVSYTPGVYIQSVVDEVKACARTLEASAGGEEAAVAGRAAAALRSVALDAKQHVR